MGELFSEERSGVVVAAAFDDTPDPRLRAVMTSLARHLHAFVKGVELTEDEWAAAVDFLTRTGHMSNEVRQEFKESLVREIVDGTLVFDITLQRDDAG